MMRQFEVEKKTTRDAFGAAVYELAKEDPTILGIGADTTSNLGMKQMAADMPDRVINIGIAEQDMVATAAGMASCGNKVFLSTFAVFATMRACEQVRMNMGYMQLNIKTVFLSSIILLEE